MKNVLILFLMMLLTSCTKNGRENTSSFNNTDLCINFDPAADFVIRSLFLYQRLNDSTTQVSLGTINFTEEDYADGKVSFYIDADDRFYLSIETYKTKVYGVDSIDFHDTGKIEWTEGEKYESPTANIWRTPSSFTFISDSGLVQGEEVDRLCDYFSISYKNRIDSKDSLAVYIRQITN